MIVIRSLRSWLTAFLYVCCWYSIHRGTSSSGRASDSHSEGTGIDARVLHSFPKNLFFLFFFFFFFKKIMKNMWKMKYLLQLRIAARIVIWSNFCDVITISKEHDCYTTHWKKIPVLPEIENETFFWRETLLPPAIMVDLRFHINKT